VSISSDMRSVLGCGSETICKQRIFNVLQVSYLYQFHGGPIPLKPTELADGVFSKISGALVVLEDVIDKRFTGLGHHMTDAISNQLHCSLYLAYRGWIKVNMVRGMPMSVSRHGWEIENVMRRDLEKRL